MEDQETRVFTKLTPDFKFEASSSKKECAPAPVNKLLKFNVGELEMTEQINTYKTDMNGKPNPDFNKPQPVFIFKGELRGNGVEADGQVYSSWVTGYYKDGDNSKPVFSFGDKSKLGKIAEALAGSVAAYQKLLASEIQGLPFQCALAPGKKDPNRQVLNIDKIMPADESQTKVTGDVVLADIPEAGDDVLAAASEVFGE